MFPFIGVEESCYLPLCLYQLTPCYVQEPLDSAFDFSHMQDELDKICDHQLQTSLSSNTVNELKLHSG